MAILRDVNSLHPKQLRMVTKALASCHEHHRQALAPALQVVVMPCRLSIACAALRLGCVRGRINVLTCDTFSCANQRALLAHMTTMMWRTP